MHSCKEKDVEEYLTRITELIRAAHKSKFDVAELHDLTKTACEISEIKHVDYRSTNSSVSTVDNHKNRISRVGVLTRAFNKVWGHIYSSNNPHTSGVNKEQSTASLNGNVRKTQFIERNCSELCELVKLADECKQFCQNFDIYLYISEDAIGSRSCSRGRSVLESKCFSVQNGGIFISSKAEFEFLRHLLTPELFVFLKKLLDFDELAYLLYPSFVRIAMVLRRFLYAWLVKFTSYQIQHSDLRISSQNDEVDWCYTAASLLSKISFVFSKTAIECFSWIFNGKLCKPEGLLADGQCRPCDNLLEDFESFELFVNTELWLDTTLIKGYIRLSLSAWHCLLLMAGITGGSEFTDDGIPRNTISLITIAQGISIPLKYASSIHELSLSRSAEPQETNSSPVDVLNSYVGLDDVWKKDLDDVPGGLENSQRETYKLKHALEFLEQKGPFSYLQLLFACAFSDKKRQPHDESCKFYEDNSNKSVIQRRDLLYKIFYNMLNTVADLLNRGAEAAGAFSVFLISKRPQVLEIQEFLFSIWEVALNEASIGTRNNKMAGTETDCFILSNGAVVNNFNGHTAERQVDNNLVHMNTQSEGNPIYCECVSIWCDYSTCKVSPIGLILLDWEYVTHCATCQRSNLLCLLTRFSAETFFKCVEMLPNNEVCDFTFERSLINLYQNASFASAKACRLAKLFSPVAYQRNLENVDFKCRYDSAISSLVQIILRLSVDLDGFRCTNGANGHGEAYYIYLKIANEAYDLLGNILTSPSVTNKSVSQIKSCLVSELQKSSNVSGLLICARLLTQTVVDLENICQQNVNNHNNNGYLTFPHTYSTWIEQRIICLKEQTMRIVEFGASMLPLDFHADMQVPVVGVYLPKLSQSSVPVSHAVDSINNNSPCALPIAEFTIWFLTAASKIDCFIEKNDEIMLLGDVHQDYFQSSEHIYRHKAIVDILFTWSCSLIPSLQSISRRCWQLLPAVASRRNQYFQVVRKLVSTLFLLGITRRLNYNIDESTYTTTRKDEHREYNGSDRDTNNIKKQTNGGKKFSMKEGLMDILQLGPSNLQKMFLKCFFLACDELCKELIENDDEDELKFSCKYITSLPIEFGKLVLKRILCIIENEEKDGAFSDNENIAATLHFWLTICDGISKTLFISSDLTSSGYKKNAKGRNIPHDDLNRPLFLGICKNILESVLELTHKLQTLGKNSSTMEAKLNDYEMINPQTIGECLGRGFHDISGHNFKQNDNYLVDIITNILSKVSPSKRQQLSQEICAVRFDHLECAAEIIGNICKIYSRFPLDCFVITPFALELKSIFQHFLPNIKTSMATPSLFAGLVAVTSNIFLISECSLAGVLNNFMDGGSTKLVFQAGDQMANVIESALPIMLVLHPVSTVPVLLEVLERLSRTKNPLWFYLLRGIQTAIEQPMLSNANPTISSEICQYMAFKLLNKIITTKEFNNWGNNEEENYKGIDSREHRNCTAIFTAATNQLRNLSISDNVKPYKISKYLFKKSPKP